MNLFVLLFRGINVGGKNKIPMTALKQFLEAQGCTDVTTYIQSGNAIVRSPLDAPTLSKQIEAALPKAFALDSSIVRVLALSHPELKAIINQRPVGFGDEPATYHSDAIFLIGIPPAEAMAVFAPREGVDKVWPGTGVIYSQRLSELRTKSRLSKIIGTPAYQFMTIRNWNTTLNLLRLLEAAKTKAD